MLHDLINWKSPYILIHYHWCNVVPYIVRHVSLNFIQSYTVQMGLSARCTDIIRDELITRPKSGDLISTIYWYLTNVTYDEELFIRMCEDAITLSDLKTLIVYAKYVNHDIQLIDILRDKFIPSAIEPFLDYATNCNSPEMFKFIEFVLNKAEPNEENAIAAYCFLVNDIQRHSYKAYTDSIRELVRDFLIKAKHPIPLLLYYHHICSCEDEPEVIEALSHTTVEKCLRYVTGYAYGNKMQVVIDIGPMMREECNVC